MWSFTILQRRFRHFLYCNSLAPIHLKAARSKVRAFEKFTGMRNSQIRHERVIRFVCDELKEERNKYIDMLIERNKWKKDFEDLKKEIEDQQQHGG